VQACVSDRGSPTEKLALEQRLAFLQEENRMMIDALAQLR
jgi:hypothetical protein